MVFPADVAGALEALIEAGPIGENYHPAYENILIDFDPFAITPQSLKERVGEITSRGPRRSKGRLIEIPVEYGGLCGPDLESLAEYLDLTRDELISRHSECEYEVAFLGFAPGFAYLTGLPEILQGPRHPSPRLKVPAGSVGIAGRQTGIYPSDSPAGWQIIGRTNLKMFDPANSQPSLLQMGDRVKFLPAVKLDWVVSHNSEIQPRDFSFVAEQPGVMTSVQDLGRVGFAHLGVSKGGAADPLALRIGNLLLGNPSAAAALEVTAGNAAFRFLRDSRFIVTGADCSVNVGGRAVRSWQMSPVFAGETVRIGPATGGFRVYLCVAGGIEVPMVMGSRSTLLSAGWGGFNGRFLRAGDCLQTGALESAAPPRSNALFMRQLYESDLSVLRVTQGPQWDWFSGAAQDGFFEQEFTVAPETNRAGLRLRESGIKRAAGYEERELVSEGVPGGTVQISSEGRPMILFCEQGTTGGYPKIANVIRADYYKLGQLSPGAKVRFKTVSLEEAWLLNRQLEDSLQSARYGI